MSLKEGDKAPNFNLDATGGKKISLSGLRGKRIVLYFYPKDSTPGCTKESCAFQADLANITELNTMVLGVSADTVDSHERFAKKYGLRFPLLSDPDKKTCEAYGVFQQKMLYGRSFLGIVRTTFIIDETGKISKVFPKVRVEGHAQAVLEALQAPVGKTA